MTVYAGIDRGFRLGGINNLGQPNYDTEIALNYEIGLKGLFLDNTLRLNATVFLTDYDGYQVVQYNSEAFTFIVQNADVIGKGVEVDAQWAPTPGLELGASVAWNDTYYDSFVGAPCDSYQLAFGTCPNDPVPGAQDLTDEPLSAAPEWVGNLTAQYTAGLGSTSHRLVHPRRVRLPGIEPVAPGWRRRRPAAGDRLVRSRQRERGTPVGQGLGYHALGQEPDGRGLLHEYLASARGLGTRLCDRPHRDGTELRG